MARRWWRRPLIMGVVLTLLMSGYECVTMIWWAGETDLEIEFVVTDAATGRPVSGAEVEIQGEPGPDALVTNEVGMVRLVWPCPCGGTRSGLQLIDTFSVRLPAWQYRVVHAGYEPSEWANLATRGSDQRMQRTGLGKSKLVVAVSLLREHRAALGPEEGESRFP